MPEEFDPAWEYYQPDPEFEEEKFIVTHGDLFEFFGSSTKEGDQRFSVDKTPKGNKHVGIKNEEDEALLRKMWDEGFTTPEIADRFGVEHTTVRQQWKKRFKLPTRTYKEVHAKRREMRMRNKLPDRRRSWTQKVKLADKDTGKYQTFYLSFGEYPDGSLGEVWIDMAKEATFTRGVLSNVARFISLSLQTGVSACEVVKMMMGYEFPPNCRPIAEGSKVERCDSITDFIAQEIEQVYVLKNADRPIHYESKDGKLVFTLVFDEPKPPERDYPEPPTKVARMGGWENVPGVPKGE